MAKIAPLNLHLNILYNEKGIQSASLRHSEKHLEWSFSSEHFNSKLENSINQWLEDYSQCKQSKIELLLDMAQLPAFTRQVLEIVKDIPMGSFYTYGQIARLMQKPQASRAIGQACGRNPIILFIPCHRVVGANYDLRGYSGFGGVAVKEKLLSFEKFNP